MKSIWLWTAILLLCAAGAQAGVSNPAAGPRTGLVSVVQITLSSRQALDELVKGGFDIDAVRGNDVILYVTPDERARLVAMGYQPVETGPQPGEKVAYAGYHTYTSLTSELQTIAAAHFDICRLQSLGPSVQGRQLWAMLISQQPDIKEDKPEACYISTMHGNEPVGMEMCMDLINYLVSNYRTDPEVTGLLDTTALWIVPLMNPDGFQNGTRYNANGYDLNRSFPMYPSDFTGNYLGGAPLNTAGRQPEVTAIMNWSAQHHFILAANFHTGSLVVNYPYDDDGKPSGVNSPSPDDALFQYISRLYSSQNLPMWNSPDFPDGITNGAAWYVVQGGMQDWAYRFMTCNEVTIELSDTYIPLASELPSLWTDNRDAMLNYIESVQIGIHGIVSDAATGKPISAKVVVAGNAQPAYSDWAIGRYQRMLLPGTYSLTFSAPGYLPDTVDNIVVTSAQPTDINVQLQAAPSPPLPTVSLEGAVFLCLSLVSAFLVSIRRQTHTGDPECV